MILSRLVRKIIPFHCHAHMAEVVDRYNMITRTSISIIPPAITQADFILEEPNMFVTVSSVR
jgi:hypothetical protein